MLGQGKYGRDYHQEMGDFFKATKGRENVPPDDYKPENNVKEFLKELHGTFCSALGFLIYVSFSFFQSYGNWAVR